MAQQRAREGPERGTRPDARTAGSRKEAAGRSNEEGSWAEGGAQSKTSAPAAQWRTAVRRVRRVSIWLRLREMPVPRAVSCML